MSIMDFIERQKEKHRANIAYKEKYGERLRQEEIKEQQQKLNDRLATAKAEAELRKSKKDLRDLRSAPARERLASIKTGFENFKKNVEKNTSKKETGINQLGGPGPNPFRPTSNPFGPDTVKKVNPEKGKTITIRLKE